MYARCSTLSVSDQYKIPFRFLVILKKLVGKKPHSIFRLSALAEVVHLYPGKMKTVINGDIQDRGLLHSRIKKWLDWNAPFEDSVACG